MSKETSASPVDKATRKRGKPRLVIVTLVALCALLWLAHPYILAKVIRVVATKAAQDAGVQLSIGTIRANIAHPLILQNINLRANDRATSQTVIVVGQAELHLSNLWGIFFGNGRIFRNLVINDLSGVLDLQQAALPPAKPATASSQQATSSALDMRLLPLNATVTGVKLKILGDDQQYDIGDASLKLSETDLGKFKAGSIGVRIGTVRQTYNSLKATTAWKDGAIYLAGLTLRPDLTVQNFTVNFATPGSTAMSVEAQTFGGSLRGDISLGNSGGEPYIDAAAWASNVNLSPLAEALGLKGKVRGMLREGRFTFRGNPEKATEAEASTRILADDFHWNERGWKSLEIGGNLIHQRLVVSQFDLQQKDNKLNFSGEVSLDKGWASLSSSPFQLNISGSIKQLGELAGLLGSPFDEMSGRMSLNGSLSGHVDDLSGYLGLEASDINFRTRPIDSVRLDTTFKDSAAQVTRLEIWSGKDFVQADGSISLSEPHNYSGEINVSLKNIASYARPFRAPKAEAIYSGALALHWQGDGTASAHSGAFTASLRDFVTAMSPAGITGQFEGTYSPQNLYFNTFALVRDSLRFFTHASIDSAGITLKNIDLSDGKESLLTGELFVPLNAFAMSQGQTWQQAAKLGQPVYADIKSPGAINLADVAQLLGKNTPITGTLRLALDAGGPLENLKLTGSVTGRGLGLHSAGTEMPPSKLDLQITTSDHRAAVTGTLATEGFSPVKVQASIPFGFQKGSDGALAWSNPTGQFSGLLDMPETNLSVFKALVPGVSQLSGNISAKITASNTLSEPRFDGRLALREGTMQTTPRAPALTNLDALVRFDTQRAVIDHIRGAIGAGPFAVTGALDFKNILNPSFNASLSGQKILLARDAGLRLRANVKIDAHGDNKGGSVAGSIRLVDGRIYKRMEITPLLAPSPATAMPVSLAPNTSAIPLPFANYTVDIKVDNETPFLLSGNIATGQINPDLQITGSLGKPVPVGTIRISNAEAYLPFSTMVIQSGEIDFTAQDPWRPILDIRGTAQTLDYEVHAYAYGPLDEHKLVLRSDPPLPQESLILLLTTGLTPGVSSGAGFGEAAAGQGSILLLKTLARQLDPRGVNLDSILNRLQVQAVAPQNQGERATLQGRFRVLDNFSLMSERDGYGFYNVGATYSFRFR